MATTPNEIHIDFKFDPEAFQSKVAEMLEPLIERAKLFSVLGEIGEDAPATRAHNITFTDPDEDLAEIRAAMVSTAATAVGMILDLDEAIAESEA